MELVDERTEEELKTHKWLVIGTDTFLSGWGRAKGGVSYAAWACKTEDLQSLEARIRARGDMKRVRVVCGSYRPRGKGHCHIYVYGR